MWPLKVNWWEVAKIAVPVILLGIAFWQVNDRAYDKGHAKAEKTCADVTVPAARLEEQTKCKESTNILKESCDALQSRLDSNVTRYVGLLRQVDACRKVPITGSVSVNAETADRNMLLVQGGVMVGELADTAKACDDQTAQLIEWQSWYGKVKTYFDKYKNQ